MDIPLFVTPDKLTS